MQYRLKTLIVASALFAATASATPFTFSTGNPDGLMATGSRTSNLGKTEIESADDFSLNQQTTINQASFTGLLTGGVPLTAIGDVVVEIYRVFPKDSQVPPSGSVPTRNNSPSDVAFLTRESAAFNLSFTTTNLGSLTANNSVLNDINPLPNQTTGGEGPVTGQEVEFNVTFTTPFSLPADHYFFVPQVDVTGGDFLWLSAPKPIIAPGTPFTPDLQSWIRNGSLDPNWLRVGTDIIGGSPAPTYNAVFSLNGQTVPEPGTLVLFGAGFAALFARRGNKLA